MSLSFLFDEGFEIIYDVAKKEFLAILDNEIDRIYETYKKYDPISLRAEFRKDISGMFVMDRIDPILDLIPALKKYIYEDLALVIEKQIGAPITVFKCKHIIKRPGTLGYSLHQDFLYWKWMGIESGSMFSVSIPLNECGSDSGELEFYAGPKLNNLVSCNAHGVTGDIEVKDLEGSNFVTPHVPLGSAIIFDSLIPHRSDVNRGMTNRSTIIISFVIGKYEQLYWNYYDYEIRRRAGSFSTGSGNECFKNIGNRINV